MDRCGPPVGATELLHRGHVHCRLSTGRISRAPHARDRLGLREELHALLAVEVEVAADGGARAGEGEHGQRDRDRDIDADLERERTCCYQSMTGAHSGATHL